jgi:hypothetical protein
MIDGMVTGRMMIDEVDSVGTMRVVMAIGGMVIDGMATG